MHEFKIILIQKIPVDKSDRDISYFMSDGIFDFTVMAEHEYQAELKMLNYFYQYIWYAGDEDMLIEEFRNLQTTDKKVEALENMKCVFEYIIYYNIEDIETTKIKI